MKQTIGILLALALALGMTACSGTEDPAQSGASGSAPAAEEVSAACEHEWIPASFTAPETCARCGETRGGLKEDYFAQNGLELLEAPPQEALPVIYITYAQADPSVCTSHTDGSFEVLDQTVEPDGEGYQLVTLEVEVHLPVPLDESTMDAWSCSWSNQLADRYTGLVLPSKDTYGSDGFDYQAQVSYDGEDYDIYYSKQVEVEGSGWYDTADGGRRNDRYFHQVYTLRVPEGYDGLVYGLIPSYQYSEETNYDTVDEETSYVTDTDPERLAATVFFRFGQPAPGAGAPQE